jgi:hypothetical protein
VVLLELVMAQLLLLWYLVIRAEIYRAEQFYFMELNND